MDIKAISKGVAVGTATGLAAYAVCAAGSKKRKSIRKNAGKALKAAGALLDDLTSAVM